MRSVLVVGLLAGSAHADPKVTCQPDPATVWLQGRTLTNDNWMPGPTRLEQVSIARTKASVTMVVRSLSAAVTGGAKRPDRLDDPRWTCDRSELLEGTIKLERAGRLILVVGAHELACEARVVAVGAADAVPLVMKSPEEGCRMRGWPRGRTVQRTVFACTSSASPTVAALFPGTLYLGRELVEATISSDCGQPPLRAVRPGRLYPTDTTR